MNKLNEFLLPPARSTSTADMDALFNFIHITSFFLLFAITVTIIWFVIKYRRRSDNDVTPLITHNNTLEITWSVIPLILVMVVFGWGYRDFLHLSSPPDDAYEINVVASSWSWQFHYQNGYVSPGELHIPAGRPVKLIMISNDVIHSFYVPEYRVKKDVLPNRYTSVWFEADEPGDSQIYCTEYCGLDHSGMLATVTAHTENEFNDWLESANTIDEDTPLDELGETLVQQFACDSCHSLTDDAAVLAPPLFGIFGTETELDDGTTVQVDENYLRQSILDPASQVVEGYNPVMPVFSGSLNDRQVDAIIEYIKTLE